MARKIGLSDYYYSCIEAGSKEVSLRTLKMVLSSLKLTQPEKQMLIRLTLKETYEIDYEAE
jgi:transcriptional regulator with XRE-family HTH domain